LQQTRNVGLRIKATGEGLKKMVEKDSLDADLQVGQGEGGEITDRSSWWSLKRKKAGKGGITPF